MTKISLQREEKLAICVQKYPALYNKVERSFHNKKEKANAWSKIAIELGMESGKEAKIMFTSLRTKYNRRKKNFKDVNRSGTSSNKLQKAEKDLNEYAFLFWLDNFIYERKGRSNLPQEESIDCDENISMETLCELEDNTESFDKDEDAISTTDVQTVSTSQQLINQDSGNITPEDVVSVASDSVAKKHSTANKKPKSKKVKMGPPPTENSDMSEKLLDTLKETFNGGDAEDVFGAYVASELRSLDARRNRIARLEISNTLNRLAMSQFYGNVPYTPQQPLDSHTNVSNSTSSQQSLPTNVQANAVSPQTGPWVESYTDFLNNDY